MAKKKTENTNLIDTHHIYYLYKIGIRIYPVYEYAWYIEVDDNDTVKRFDKIVYQDEINEALAKTILYYYNQKKLK